jgi:hypothetical protein
VAQGKECFYQAFDPDALEKGRREIHKVSARSCPEAFVVQAVMGRDFRRSA